MSNIFTLTPDIKDIASQAIDDLINELGKDCLLVLPARPVKCSNCIYDPAGKKSSNRWITGGSIPFPNGQICPLCNGSGNEAVEKTLPIKLLLTWNPKDFWIKSPANVQVPAGRIQAKGFMTDFDNINQCRQLIVEVKIQGHARYRFTLAGEVIDPGNIIQGRYCISTWDRNGG